MKMEEAVAGIYKRRSGRIGLHILFWICFFFARSYIEFIRINPGSITQHSVYLVSFFNTITTAIAFYALAYFIWPRFVIKRKYAVGIFLLVCMIVAYTLLDYFGELLLLRDPEWRNFQVRTNVDYYNYLQQDALTIMLKRILTLGILYQLLIFLAFPVAIKIGIAYLRQQITAAQLMKENVQLELNFLKSQINPHFLFNTLNNIYSLILHDKKELSTKTITRLSEFIRYSLYEAGAEKVPLESEARLLENYVELERIRLNCTSVTFEYNSDNGSYRLPPLLFLPVAENAFKYTADEAGNHIFLQMRASGGLLEFSARNSSTEIHDSKEGGGIGLLNFSKRLKLYYGEKAKYNVVRENGSYFVHVSIELT